MTTGQKRGVTVAQLLKLSKDLNLTVGAIAEGTGLSKAYVSEFRNETRNLSATQQAQLRAFLEQKCQDAGVDFPESDEPDTNAPTAKMLQQLGGMVVHVNRPALPLSEDVPKAQRDQLLDLIDMNRLKVADLLAGDFTTTSGPFTSGEFTQDTEEAIRQVFALLAMNYLAVLMLQGRNIVRRVPDPAEFEPKTVGDWLSRHLAASPLGELLPPMPKQRKVPALAEGDDE